MTEAAALGWLYKLLNGLCSTHVALRVACAVAIGFGWMIWEANQNAKSQLAFERDVALRQLAELHRQAEHRRLLELMEKLKPRRDLTQPAEPGEGY